jgi:hypothetical protein
VIEGKSGENKNKNWKGKAKQNTVFKKKNLADITCFLCGEPVHIARKCHNRKGKKGCGQKSASVIVSEARGFEYEPNILLACQSTDWWLDTGADVHVYSDLNLFSSYHVTDSCSILMGDGSRIVVHGIGRVNLKLTSEKTLSLKNVQHVPRICRNLISGSILCRDGFKLVFDSNKFIVSKFGLFIGKGYDNGGLFRLSVIDDYNNVASSISCSELNVGEAAVCHSHLYHINFDHIIRLSKFNLIPKIPIVRRSKCHACVQAKQPHKPFKSMEEKSLAPLDLIYSVLCEMNGILARAANKYFISFINDATRYCQLYLVKMNDEALNFFKIYKVEVENQLERKIKQVRSDRGHEYLSNDFDEYCAEHGIIDETTKL